ncbi:T6SS phospholipase effector Tle1-like catalytic domain-containing protein [Bradyrhizobium betae]|uniref:T6SS phospholipase effector Tle1-like catalytic domain-containing protein n=1 Tax=Bradyrhizobium betae TaxID=244734 RepID=UPI003D665A8B
MKHLISLIDGTWISPNRIGAGETHSNIYKINLLLADDFASDRKQQIVFYSRGLGAVSGVRRYTSGGFAYGIKEEIEDVYINIASNYVRGETNDSSDKIYLYGFSRGAVIARVVAALISNIGLLYPWEIDAFPKIWRLYREKQVFLDYHRPPECHERADIEFLGVFDTVYGGNDDDASAERRLQFAGRVLSRNVKNALHILAIDEQRPFFRPLLWEESEDTNAVAHKGMRQIWMPGVHADIGG